MTSLSNSSSDSGKTCCILVGSAGCGKSTLVENMSSDGIKRSGNSCESVTKSISVTQHKTISNLLLMDTIGCEDTRNTLTDDEILKEITDKLAKSGAPKIKVLWCAKPEDRTTPKLQKQAKFINSLVNGNWGAVQVIIKKGTDEDDSSGLRGAVSPYSSIDLPIYDLHCLDKIKNVKKNKFYKHAIKCNLEDRIEDGFLYSKELNGVISKKINKLKSGTANLKKEFYHKKTGILQVKLKHKNDSYLIKYWHHSGICREVTTSTSYGCRRRGHTDQEYCKYAHGSWVSYWECDYCGKNIKVGHNFYHCLKCCDRSSHGRGRSIVKKCAGMFCTSCGQTKYETKESKYTCCGGSQGSSGCRVEYKLWSCCKGGENGSGCVEDHKVWNCCGAKENEKLKKICGDWKWVPKGLD